jgi:adenylate cyclase
LVRSTSNAIYFEIGLICLDFVAALLAIAVGLYVSVWLGLLLFVVLVLGLISLACNYDAWVVRRLSTEESPLLLSLCKTGFIGRLRRMLRIIPSEPRCRFCQAPFGGVGKVIAIRPSSANPNYCRSCFDALPTATYELDVGMLFADLRGFTSWSESRDSRDATDLVTRFYATSNRVLTVDDAFIDFIGDQVMAIYIVDMPSLGSSTADVMLAASRRLVDAVRQDAGLLPVGVGMHMGAAQVGSLATGASKNFTAVGDVVNTAARLQSAAGAYEVLVSEKVYRALSGKKPPAERATLELKGKAEPLTAFILR